MTAASPYSISPSSLVSISLPPKRVWCNNAHLKLGSGMYTISVGDLAKLRKGKSVSKKRSCVFIIQEFLLLFLKINQNNIFFSAIIKFIFNECFIVFWNCTVSKG